jgi:hypothetical protein
MAKRKTSSDVNVTAFETLMAVTGEAIHTPRNGKPTKKSPQPLLPVKKNPAAVALGRLGGLKGGKARAEKLSSRKRQAIARKAAKARWSKRTT